MSGQNGGWADGLATANQALQAQCNALTNQLAGLQNQQTNVTQIISGLHSTIAARDAKIRRGIREHGDWDSAQPQAPPRSAQTSWTQDYDTHGYDEGVFNKSCLYGNMSRKVTHPYVRFKDNGGVNRTYTPTVIPDEPFDFMGLPVNIQAMIFRLCLKKSSPIHCFSRLDHYGHLRLPEAAKRTRSGFPSKFHIGKPVTWCSLNAALDPNRVLALLLVDRHFLHMGATAFYSLNTFAFSSLGEFGRFMSGIGTARRQRIQSISICLIGSRMPRLREPGKKKLPNRRTKPLRWLLHTVRLKRVAIYLNEGKDYQRRQYDTDELPRETRTYANSCWNRSLYATHGMDFFMQLRGIKRFHIYNYAASRVTIEEDAENGNNSRRRNYQNVEIQDTHYLKCVRQQVMQPKKPERVLSSQLHKLKHFHRKRPNDQAKSVANHILKPRRPIFAPLIPDFTSNNRTSNRAIDLTVVGVGPQGNSQDDSIAIEEDDPDELMFLQEQRVISIIDDDELTFVGQHQVPNRSNHSHINHPVIKLDDVKDEKKPELTSIDLDIEATATTLPFAYETFDHANQGDGVQIHSQPVANDPNYRARYSMDARLYDRDARRSLSATETDELPTQFGTIPSIESYRDVKVEEGEQENQPAQFMTSAITCPMRTKEGAENSTGAHMFYPTPRSQNRSASRFVGQNGELTGLPLQRDSASLFVGQSEEPEEKYTIPATDSEDLYRDPSEHPEGKPAFSSMVPEHLLEPSSQHGGELPAMEASGASEDVTDDEQKYQPSPSPMPVIESSIRNRSASAPIVQPYSSTPNVSRKRHHSASSSDGPRINHIRRRL